MKRIIIIGLLFLSMFFIGCKEIQIIDCTEDASCSMHGATNIGNEGWEKDPITNEWKYIRNENKDWEYELECDEWGYTGETIYVEKKDCIDYVLLINNTWIKEEEWYMNDAYYKFKIADDKCNRLQQSEYCEQADYFRKQDENLQTYIAQYTDCRKEPVQEKECTHKKVVGVKKK